jgi:Tol biopolymer transport system component
MTDLDRASLDRILPSTPGSADWEDVLRRSGADRGARRPRFVALAAAVLVVVVGTASAFGTVRDLFLATRVNSKMAFSSFRDGQWDAYVMNTNGSGQRRLTAKPNDRLPVWSPDGRKIVYATGWPDNPDLYVMNADGSGLRRLTRGAAWDGGPAWSPDGRKIAFTRTIPPGEVSGPWQSDVYVINVDGSGERNLTGDAVSWGPVWSPDGQKIAYTSLRDGKPGIYVMNADGSGQQRLMRNSGVLPSWSPDGRKIAFVRATGGAFRDGGGPPYIYVMNADGSRPRRLTRMAGVNNSLPSWSPEGRKIVFVSERDGNFEVYSMNADGSGRRNLTRHPGHDSDPVWSPDGRKIAFVTKRDGNFEVYVMNADGSGQQNLTRNPAPDRSPVWSPGMKGN